MKDFSSLETKQRFTVLPVECQITEESIKNCDEKISEVTSNYHNESFSFSSSTHRKWKMNCNCLIPGITKFRNLFLVSSNPKLFRKLMKHQFGGYEAERKRHLLTFPKTVHPFSNFRWCWDIFMTIALIVTLIGIPIQIAFYSDTLSHTELITTSTCFIFFIDILLNFRTGYIGRESDQVILDPSLITKHYLKTWFWVDFTSTIPFDLIYIAIEDVNPHARVYFKFFRLLELLKILRLARVVNHLTKLQQANDIPPMYGRLINLITTMFFVLHWLACMHYLVADLTHRREGKNRHENRSWVSVMDIWDHPVWEKYLHCVLRALSNMGCLGYGFVSPKSPEDVICTIACILIGATWFALFIANVSNIVLNMDASHKKYDETLNHVLEYMKFKHMPKDLQSRVEKYFEQKYRHNLFDEEEILGSLSRVLRSQVQMFNCQHLVYEVPIFQGIPAEIIHEIVSVLKCEVFLPHDVILWENTIGDSMFFIQRGSVEVLTRSGKILTLLHDGNFFGEMALITKDHRRCATIVATTRCEIYSLSKPEFERIVSMYPEVFDSILAVAKERAKQIYTENRECISSAEETIRIRSQPQFRQNIRDAFQRNPSQLENMMNQENQFNRSYFKENNQSRILKDASYASIEECLNEILKMNPRCNPISGAI